jgi:hypothetical protein
MFWRSCTLLVLLTSTAGAQKFEIGGLGGGGAFVAEDASATYWVAGAEACFFCNGRAALFAGYSHYGLASGGSVIHSADLVSGGLRVQTKPARVRPYFDIGITGGQDHFLNRAHNLVGLALGGGVAISLGQHWYVRPGVQLHVTNGPHVGMAGVASLGYRF